LSNELTFDENKHEYKFDGIIIPSVTQIIGDIFPISDFISKDLLKEKADLGKKIHSTTELYDRGTLDVDKLHPILKAYLDSWVKFRKDFNVQFDLDSFSEQIETLLYHSVYKFAGRVDRIPFVDKERCIIDIKSGMEQKTHALQTAAYAMLANQLLDRKFKIKKRYAVYLSETGYKVIEHKNTNDENVFLSCLTIYNYRRSK
jgi:hypothetical protein